MCRIIQRRNRNNVLLSSTRNLWFCLLKLSAFVETEAKALWVVGGRQKNRLKNFSALSKPAARNYFSPLSHFSLISLFWQNWKTDSMASVLLSICLQHHGSVISSSSFAPLQFLQSAPHTPSSSSESSVVPAHIWPLTLTRRDAIMLLLLKCVADTNNWLPSTTLLLQNMHGLS